ncbi:CpaF/VirB11 family protein (plasmid) [Alicyclobacillus fastidiosus]|uniref:CpaF/VirB11 family protein n=2 Tax=Alicyclobacillus fastidiosus TaxID=392011 RepID=A0ABY6ZPX9_9BACL|nr:ATPase, T2SS/T4P/T4SS family [Alicyclobacillus fastidiosus]WAH44892.1 CpaF/VirB11 family protein [Alicyclobacillus fastidiosus]
MLVNEILPVAPFLANRYLSRQQTKRVASKGEVNFSKAIEGLKKYLENKNDTSSMAYLERKKAAIIGEPAAKQFFIQMIHEFLRDSPQYQNTRYPSYYPNLQEALFQHHLGFGPMSVWFANPTESALVNGTQILFGVKGRNTKVLQPFAYDSITQVEKLIRSLTLKDNSQQLDVTNNWTQVDMYDGTRVTIFQPPLSETYVLIFRQYLFKEYTFEHEAELRTIPSDAVQWFKYLSQLMLSTLTTGIRGSGKTTMIKVIAGARNPQYGVVTAEGGTFEAHMKRDFPERAAYIIALKTELDQMDDLFPAFVRADAHYIMIPEIRSREADLAVKSRERGNGWLGSYHSPYVYNIPLEFADLLLEDQPNRNHHSAYVRAAQAIDVAITMWEDPSGRKIVTGVYAYEYEPETKSFSVTTWMKYNRTKDNWTFHSEMPLYMSERLQDTYPEVLELFLNEFQHLAEKYPFTGQAVRTVQIGG